MTDLIIPPWIQPDNDDAEPLDEASAQFRPQFAPGVTQRNSFGGLRPRFSRVHTVRQEELGFLSASLMETDGQYGLVYSKPYRLRRGSFAATELATNGTFVNGTTGWTSSDASQSTISVSDRTLRSFRIGIVSSPTIQMASVTVTNAVYYLMRVFVKQGRGGLRYRLRLGTSAGGAEIAASGADITTPGMQELIGLASGTTMHLSILDVFTGKSASDFMDIPYVSLARCLLVNGASQSGSALIVDQLTASTNGLILPGDWISIANELKCVTAPVNGDSSGNAYVRFKPQLFRSPANDAPIAVVDPMGKFLMSNFRDRNRFGSDAVISYDLEHVYE